MKSKGSLQSLIEPLRQIACEAGRAILEVYETKFEVDYKEDSSPLTMADRRSHDIILEGLASLVCSPVFTEPIPVLSEEGRDIPYSERSKWKVFWMVDPLDGTKEFVKRNGEFTINIALIADNLPVLGVVYLPVPDVLYCGYADDSGSLAHRYRSACKSDSFLQQGERLPLASESDPEPRLLRIAGSRSHSGAEFEAFVEEKRREYDRVEVLYAGSALKFCVVAEGKADVYPRFGPTMEWDTAAGHAVARGAGRIVVAHPSGAEFLYNKRELKNGPFICRGYVRKDMR